MAGVEKSPEAVQIEKQNGENASCWSCGDMVEQHFCHSCGKVQPARPTDYFSFFGLPKKLNLDAAALEKEFYQLSRKLHPDLAARASKKEQEWALQQSSLLNDAHRTLRDPYLRTEYLLKLEGVKTEEQSKQATEQARATGEIKKQQVPPELLEEVFELNMQLEEARMNKKMGEQDENLARELEQTKQNLQKKQEEVAQELKRYWDEWDQFVERQEAGDQDAVPDQEKPSILKKMVSVLNRRSYLRNLIRDVNEVLEN